MLALWLNHCRAYVVHKTGVINAHKSFPKDVQLWIEARVAKHKFLRGGVVVIDAIPKRFVIFDVYCKYWRYICSAAGKILRRELRERAKSELGMNTVLKTKL
jgi:acyl-CoA synthetase (AMP-forming)/AMP-acid ligase II